MTELDQNLYSILFQLEQYALVADEMSAAFSEGVFGLAKHRKGQHALIGSADLRQEFEASSSVVYNIKEVLENNDETVACCKLQRDGAEKQDLMRVSVFPSPALKASQKHFSTCLQHLIHLASIKQHIMLHSEHLAYQQGDLPGEERQYTAQALSAALVEKSEDELLDEQKVHTHEEQKAERVNVPNNHRVIEAASRGATAPMSADLDSSSDEEEDD